MNKDFQFSQYSDKSFVLRGDRDALNKVIIGDLKGRWNPRLKGGPGWLVPISNKQKIIRLASYIAMNGLSCVPYKMDEEVVSISCIQSLQKNIIQSLSNIGLNINDIHLTERNEDNKSNKGKGNRVNESNESMGTEIAYIYKELFENRIEQYKLLKNE